MLWPMLLNILLAVHIVRCDIRQHFGTRQFLPPNYQIPNYSEGVPYTQMFPRLNLQYFSTDYAFFQKHKYIETILEGFILVIKGSLDLLEKQNMSIYSKNKAEVKAIFMMAKSILPLFSIEWSKNLNNTKVSLQFWSHENLLRWQSISLPKYDNKVTQTHRKVEILAENSANNTNKCQSCKMLQRVKLMSLQVIKTQILKRLQISRFPNITKPIDVPNNIIDKFYKNFHTMLKKKSTFDDFEIQSQSELKEKHLIFLKSHNKSDALKMPQFDQFSNMKSKSDYHGSRHNPHFYWNFNLDNRNRELPRSIGEKEAQNDDSRTIHQRNVGVDMLSVTGNHGKEQVFKRRATEGYAEFSNYDNYDGNYENLQVIDDEPYSHVNSLYFFPTVSRVPHSHKWEVSNIKFVPNYLSIVRTIIHLYVRGYDWILEHSPEILEQKLSDEKIRRPFELIIIIHYVVRCSSNQNFTHSKKLLESHQSIPSGRGQWVQFEIKNIPPSLMNQNTVTMKFAIKTKEPWMQPFLAVDTEDQPDKRFALHIELFVKQPRRRKRSTSLDCQESDHEVRCCRYPLKVNFTNFGWNFVVAPTSFDAYFCNGECKVGYMEQYTHTHITSLTTSATPCCSPTKMRPLSLLYFDQDQNLVLSTIPNMSVEKCSCS